MLEEVSSSGEFTITKLNKALNAQDFDKAESLIKQNNIPRFLYNGPYGHHPFTFVLEHSSYSNLYLAKLLVEQGLEVTYHHKYDTHTPLECVVFMYKDVSGQCNSESEFINRIPIIGLNRRSITSAVELREQLWELIELLIAHGADPNIVKRPGGRSLFHSMVSSNEPDMKVISKLFYAGGDFNKRDFKGETPIMSLISFDKADIAWHVFTQILNLTGDLDFNGRYFNGDTLFWRAMFEGFPRIAIELIRRGADYIELDPVCFKSRLPIFAPLLMNSRPCINWFKRKGFDTSFQHELLNEVTSRYISPVVDATDIHNSVIPVLSNLLTLFTRFPLEVFVANGVDVEEVTLLMFGNLKAGLQQLCVRKIIGSVMSARWKMAEEDSSGTLEGCNNVDHVYSAIQQLTPSAIEILVKDYLRLPPCVIQRFMIEAARFQFLAGQWSNWYN